MNKIPEDSMASSGEIGEADSMNCRPGCGACCIAPSISSSIPGMPDGKPAGVRCVQLTPENICLLFGEAERPAVCRRLQPGAGMCGGSPEEAMDILDTLERETEPGDS